MLEIGKLNHLTVILNHSSGTYLDGGDAGKILLPPRETAIPYAVGDELGVFVYLASDGQLMATTQLPKAQVDEFAWLKVLTITDVGAFLDWGLPKDLLLPYSEQKYPLEVGRHCLVKILYSPERGITATTRIEDYLNYETYYLKEGQAVSLLIADKTDTGIKAIVNHKFWGLLYHNEVFQSLRKGQKIDGYIKRIREDRRIDLCLYPPGYSKVEGFAGKILEKLQHQQGYLALNDKSPPEIIYHQFGVSKKVFKQAIGSLYKQRLILIEDQGIRLVDSSHENNA